MDYRASHFKPSLLQDAPVYLVPDLKNFISPECLEEAERLQGKLLAEHPNVKEMSVAQREQLGLEYVDEVVNMFIRCKAVNQEILCLGGKRVARPGFFALHFGTEPSRKVRGTSFATFRVGVFWKVGGHHLAPLKT